jgi:hypothetical protein
MSRAGESREEPLNYGPKMLAISDMRRRFVEALFTVEVEKGKSRITAAAKAAGFTCANDHNFHAAGCNIMRVPAVQAAIAEHYAGMTKTLGPKIYAAIERIIDDPDHPDHAKVVIAFADKLDPTPRGPVVEIQQTTINVQSGEDMLRRINELAAKHGMDPALLLNGRAPVMIEAKPEPPAELAAESTFKGW